RNWITIAANAAQKPSSSSKADRYNKQFLSDPLRSVFQTMGYLLFDLFLLAVRAPLLFSFRYRRFNFAAAHFGHFLIHLFYGLFGTISPLRFQVCQPFAFSYLLQRIINILPCFTKFGAYSFIPWPPHYRSVRHVKISIAVTWLTLQTS